MKITDRRKLLLIAEIVSPRAELLCPSTSAQVLMPMVNLEMAMARLKEFQAFVDSYLVIDEDYGKIPGTPKATLLKSGAEKLCDIYGLGRRLHNRISR